MNDLPRVIKFSSVESYVQDVTQISFSSFTKDIELCFTKVAQDLRHVAEWFCPNHLLINLDKTKLVMLGVMQLLSKVPLVRVPFLGQDLDPVSSVKYLGIILDSNLIFNDHVISLTSSLLFILYVL